MALDFIVVNEILTERNNETVLLVFRDSSRVHTFDAEATHNCSIKIFFLYFFLVSDHIFTLWSYVLLPKLP